MSAANWTACSKEFHCISSYSQNIVRELIKTAIPHKFVDTIVFVKIAVFRGKVPRRNMMDSRILSDFMGTTTVETQSPDYVLNLAMVTLTAARNLHAARERAHEVPTTKQLILTTVRFTFWIPLQ
jgi:hypothetical protein